VVAYRQRSASALFAFGGQFRLIKKRINEVMRSLPVSIHDGEFDCQSQPLNRALIPEFLSIAYPYPGCHAAPS
jgi:hypothetical protein